MLKTLLKKPLRLELDDRTVSFGSLADFEFSLASRTEVPARKIAELVRLAPEALEREAGLIRQTERRFVEVLSRALEETGSIGHLLREVDAKIFSQDHDWRAIMSGLMRLDRHYDEYKKLALVKYLQYLGARQDVLQTLFAYKHPEDTGAAPAPPAVGGTDFKETLIFDVPLYPPPADEEASSRLQRLPRGETVSVRLLEGDEIELILSRHRFVIVGGPTVYLADENGSDYALHAGRNVVGRQPDNDVVVDVAYRDVSRKHLIIDVDPGGTLGFTDLSSHGTYVPPGCIEVTVDRAEVPRAW